MTYFLVKAFSMARTKTKYTKLDLSKGVASSSSEQHPSYEILPILEIQYLSDHSPLEDSGVNAKVRLRVLPLECWHPKALSKITTKLGTPIICDESTFEHQRLSHTRVLVEIDATTEPKMSVPIKSMNVQHFSHISSRAKEADDELIASQDALQADLMNEAIRVSLGQL
ncbi:hypothetical protein C2S51_000789 [Perilla frutescens var. frutescens]|nr:hypothetical protein C2S51_000789 [Perilla frutescens var. frutescens]